MNKYYKYELKTMSRNGVEIIETTYHVFQKDKTISIHKFTEPNLLMSISISKRVSQITQFMRDMKFIEIEEEEFMEIYNEAITELNIDYEEIL